MAKHLIDAGHSVALWSFTADKAGKLAAGGNAMSRECILDAEGLGQKAKLGAIVEWRRRAC